MKKILFLLLVTISSYGQTYQNPTFGTVTTKTAPTVTSVNYLATVEATGVISKIAPVNLPFTPKPRWGYAAAVNNGTRTIAINEDALDVSGSPITNYTINLPTVTEARTITIAFDCDITNLTIGASGAIDYYPPRAKTYDTWSFTYEPTNNRWITDDYFTGDLGAQISSLPNKSTLGDTDLFAISDGSNSGLPKKVTALSLYNNYVKNKSDLLYQNKLSWKTPQDYGAVGDGVSDDTEAMQNCFNNNKNVLLYGTYLITGIIDIQSDQTIFSNGAVMKKETVPEPLLRAVNKNTWSILGRLHLLGNKTEFGNIYTELADGLVVTGGIQYTITGLTSQNFSGSGIKFLNGISGSRGDRGIISDCFFLNNFNGVVIGDSMQYLSFVNVNIRGNATIGAYVGGGNNSFTAGNISDNSNGIYIGGLTGSNNSHGIINGVNINHNDLTGGYNVRLENAEFGQTFTGCHIYGGTKNIEIVNSQVASFSNCIIDGKIDLQDTTDISKHYFIGCQIEPSITLSGYTQNIIFRTCFNRNGSPYSGNSDYIVTGESIPLTEGYDSFGNFGIFSTDANGIDKGGALSLGGNFYSDINGEQRASFAQISGRKRTAVNGSISGYISFKVSNNSVAPYLNEVGRWYDDKLQINSLAGTGTRQVVADASGNLSATDIAPTSGTYTPTLTATGNITGLTLVNATYTRVGNIVSVNVGVTLSATSINTSSSFTISLPFNRPTSGGVYLGSGAVVASGGVNTLYPVAVASTTTTTATAYFTPIAVSGGFSGSAIFQYSL